MTIAQITQKIKSLTQKAVKQTVLIGRACWRVLSFSLFDQRIAPGQCLSLEISTEGVFVVYVSRFLSRLKILGMRRYHFDHGKLPTPQNVVSAAVLAASDLHAGQAKIVLVIPKSWVVIKTAQFPLTVKDNLSAVVSYELDRLTPLKADSAFYDFRSVYESENRLNVLLVAVNTAVLQPYLESLESKGIRVSQVTTSTSVIGTLTSYIRRKGDTIFIHIHAGGYEGGLIRDGQWQMPLVENFLSGDDQSKLLMITERINSLAISSKKKAKSRKSSSAICHPRHGVWDCPIRCRRPSTLSVKWIGKSGPGKKSI